MATQNNLMAKPAKAPESVSKTASGKTGYKYPRSQGKSIQGLMGQPGMRNAMKKMQTYARGATHPFNPMAKNSQAVPTGGTGAAAQAIAKKYAR